MSASADMSSTTIFSPTGASFLTSIFPRLASSPTRSTYLAWNRRSLEGTSEGAGLNSVDSLVMSS